MLEQMLAQPTPRIRETETGLRLNGLTETADKRLNDLPGIPSGELIVGNAKLRVQIRFFRFKLVDL